MPVYTPPTVPAPMRTQVERLLGDLDLYAKIHTVQDKDTKARVPFSPLPMQSKIFAAVRAGHRRIIVCKARQVAATTGAKMVLHHLASTTPHRAMHAVVSMRSDSASALLDDHAAWVDDLPELLRRPTRVTRNAVEWPDTGASIRAYTSRSRTGLRSFAPAAALISEAAYAPDLEEVIAQVDAAVGDGLLVVESTARNPNDFFSRLVRDPPEGWHLITLWWWEHPAYEDVPPPDFSPTPEEVKYGERYGLTPGQLAWRRRTIARLGSEQKFCREYPACMDDALLDVGGGFFPAEATQHIDVLDFSVTGDTREIEPPQPGDRYVVGVDTAGGAGGRSDYSALAVVSVTTRQPVFMARSNTASPKDWAHRVVQVATRYNNALVLAESNNHGHALLLELDACGYRTQWRHPSTGRPWVTTVQSKVEIFDTLREHLPLVRMLDRITYLELRSLVVGTSPAPSAPDGAHDDAAVAIALAYRALRDVPPSWRVGVTMPTNRIDQLLSASRARRIRATRAMPFHT